MVELAARLGPLLLTVAFRQAAEAALRCPAAPRGGGARASIVAWYAAYGTLFSLALWRLGSGAAFAELWAGYATMWCGILLRLLSLREIGVFYACLIVIRDGHRLVDTGPYRWLRHPLHLGLHIEMAGLALLAATPVAFLVLGLSVMVLAWRNAEEERVLRKHFGSAYCAYRRRAWDLIDVLPGRKKP